MSVRAAAAYALGCMSEFAQFLVTTDLESVATMCFRAFDGANYETRKAIAKCLGMLLAATQQKVRSVEGVYIPSKLCFAFLLFYS